MPPKTGADSLNVDWWRLQRWHFLHEQQGLSCYLTILVKSKLSKQKFHVVERVMRRISVAVFVTK